MRRFIITGLLATCVAVCVAVAEEKAVDPVAVEMKRDVVLRALVDELKRNEEGLKLEDLARPYFAEYVLVDSVDAYVSATLGALLSRSENPSRDLRTQLRVGSYELDNTNFRGPGYYYDSGAPVPVEDDYEAIRQAIWWASDRNYKDVIETLEAKTAFMKTKMIEDKPNDFSRETPVVYFDEKAEVKVDLDRLEAVGTKVSNVFRKYPDVQRSGVTIQVRGGNQYLVNTEGARLRIRDRIYTLSVGATVQADDGMTLTDSIQVHARSFDALPTVEALATQCDAMVKRLLAVKAAPKLEAYSGPVLFEAEAAAPLFLGHIGMRFSGGQRAVGSRSRPDDFEKKIGRRILPRSVDIVDDPTKEVINGVTVMGHYEYDDQGVKARPVQLVEGGRLKAQLMSRNPSRVADKSTGHGRGRGDASPGCLVVTARDGVDAATMKQEQLEACQDEGLEFGIRVEALGRGGVSAPLVIYKVFPDGREELVRGAEIARIDVKAFKRLLAVGDTPYVLNRTTAGGLTAAVPALLFEELDLAKIDRDFDKPPILPSPLARKVEGTEAQ